MWMVLLVTDSYLEKKYDISFSKDTMCSMLLCCKTWIKKRLELHGESKLCIEKKNNMKYLVFLLRQYFMEWIAAWFLFTGSLTCS